ncbi:MAG: hypothetical protein HGA98_00925 [Deltaproteobacteria bacterium]|nr:hypothetical protein [Deltaproteobacteria bacterium]
MTGQLAKIARFLRGPLPLLLRRFFLDGVVVGSAGLVLFWYRWPVSVKG